MFFSGASTNILALELAAGAGVNIPSPWIYWLVASSVPSAVCIILCPWIVYSLVPPERKVPYTALGMTLISANNIGT
jgi:DASS family divalent anion:Na+ symporter